ncbi:MAG: DNA adenine methylase [Verrucomicrobiota bacterium]
MPFPGGKARCFQHLINLIPPHRTYIETHLGGGAVLRHKVAAETNIGIDRDENVIARFVGSFGPNYRFIASRAEDFLRNYVFDGTEFVYLDPPYWPASRRSKRRPYAFDYSEEDHRTLLRLIRALPCAIMISGYRNSCYDEVLADWNQRSFMTTSRVGRREETVWFNYESGLLHDMRYLGRSFRERQSIKRRRQRWASRFQRESRPMQQALLSDLSSIFARGQTPP